MANKSKAQRAEEEAAAAAAKPADAAGTGTSEPAAAKDQAGADPVDPEVDPADEPEQPSAPAPAKPEDPDADDEADDEPAATATIVPMDNGKTEASPAAKELLLDACEAFGVNPIVEADPGELLSWNYYPGDRMGRFPASVVIVTYGGVKLKWFADRNHPMDPTTEEILARLFKAFKTDAKTQAVERTALPADLALPIAAITGKAGTERHVYRRGYLREGGKTEATRRAKEDRKKQR